MSLISAGSILLDSTFKVFSIKMNVSESGTQKSPWCTWPELIAGERFHYYLERKSSIMGLRSRGGHQHLQIGRMLDIDLISDPPPTPPPPRCMYTKCENLCGQRGRKPFIASWVLRMSHICPCTPCPSPKGYRSKVKSHNFAHHCSGEINNQVHWSPLSLAMA